MLVIWTFAIHMSSKMFSSPTQTLFLCFRPNLDRHTAALRLQAMCRKRQEKKEKEEMDLKNVYQPQFTAKFKGHRNARTMVGACINHHLQHAANQSSR